MIGVALSNADSFVAPWGAGRRYLGTNPLAIGLPAGEEVPVGLDMATSVVAHGKIKLAHDAGQSIPLGWALDKDGNPTTDPAAALEGALLPFGEAKGSAISLIIDLLCGPLAGALTGPFIAPLFSETDRPQGLGHVFMAINVAAFTDLETYKREMDEAIRRVHALRPRPVSTGCWCRASWSWSGSGRPGRRASTSRSPRPGSWRSWRSASTWPDPTRSQPGQGAYSTTSGRGW